MKLKTVLVLVILFTGTSLATSFEVKDSCGPTEEPMFSIYSETGGNAGMPGYFDKQICAEGVSESGFYQSCPREMSPVLSFYQKNDSHVSTFQNYDWKLCATGINSSINSSCPEENSIVSLKSKDDTHVAEPNYYGNRLCGKMEKPVNISLEIKSDLGEVYVDGEKTGEGEYTATDLSYPYIVSDQPLGIVSYGEFSSLQYESGSKDSLKMTQERGTFLIPHTEEGHTEIDEEESLITGRRFLKLPEPAFGFESPENPVVRVRFVPNHPVIGFENSLRRNIELGVRNRLGSESALEIKTR